MLFTRRRLLFLGAFGALGYGVSRCRPFRGLYGRLAIPALPNTPPDDLDDATLAVLERVVPAVLQTSVPTAHYIEALRYRASYFNGYLDLYRSCARDLDERCRQNGWGSLVDVSPEITARLVTDERPTSYLGARLTGRGEWVAYEHYIFREIVDIYARTDAWIDLGYDHWPWKARGLDAYRQAPGTLK